MARQKEKTSDRFGSGGNKDGSPEEKFFTGDVDIQVDPEWKAMELLRNAIDDLTDVVNANDEASGSYADLKKEYLASSGSFSTRVSKILVIGEARQQAMSGDTTTITSGQASAITANTAKNTNADQSKADINALDITEVGTISSGVWQGTTIKTDYIGDDQVTEDKLADTLLAEIDANTAKTGTTSTERTRIAANHDASGSFSTRVTANDAKVTNADQSKSDINALDITEVGTISSGVWQGTTIKTTYIADANISMAKLANIATDTFIGRTASNTGVPKALSKAEALAILNVEDGATADQSDAEILTAIEDGVDSVHYVDGSIDTDHIAAAQVTMAKLANIDTDTFIGRTASSAGVPKALSKTEALAILNVENGATADQSDAEILTAIEDGVDSVHYKDGSIDTDHIADDQVTADKLADSINSAIAANTAKNTNADQSKADINALDITEVGTISSGVWQGTTIKSAYIGADQVTEDKLANTLLAEIDANTAKVGTTSTERARITANHAKVGISTTQAATVNNLHFEGGAIIPTATEGCTVVASVTKSRGGVINALVFTVVDSSGKPAVTKTVTLALR